MDTTSKLLFGSGALLAVLVGLAVYVAVTAGPGLDRATATVVVAREEIPERMLFTGTNLGQLLTTRQVPTDTVPAGALRQPAEAIGKMTTTSLARNEIVLGTTARLAGGEGVAARAAAAIPRDLVALAIPATEALSVGGALQPGDRVDVIATWTPPNGQPTTQNIFQDVRVFAVGRWQGEGRGRSLVAGAAAAVGVASAAAGPNTTITVLVDYQQAVVLEYLLQTGGQIALALRRFDQGGEIPTEPVTAEALTRRFLGVDGEGSSR